ncbi:MAG: hypothetical protein ACI9XO_000468 [Paraglaciecola sp.]|jgi:hypothetical protein
MVILKIIMFYYKKQGSLINPVEQSILKTLCALPVAAQVAF